MNTSFPSLRIEGGLLSGEIIDKIAEASPDIPGQKPVDFGLEPNRPLIDEIASAWNDARSYWALFQKSLERLKQDDPGTTITRDRWMVPFFSLLGYNLQPQRKAAGIEGASYFISHRAGVHDQAPPIHITGFRQSLDRRPESGVPRLAPHSLVQEYLNRSEELWGIVTNGFTLRLLRDSHLIRRQAYIEFDLKEIIEGERFADFALLYRLLHATRLPKGIDDADKCLLEKYYRLTVEQGGRVREHLRDGVERALVRFGNGFLQHPKNAALRTKVKQKEIEPFEYYQQLLRLIYRFLFLMVSEERGLISDNELYRQHYSITRIRNLAGTAAAYNEFEDLWASLRATFSLFTDESAGALLQVPPLNGDLFDPVRTDAFNHLSLSNRDLLHAMWDLSMYREKDKAPWRRINYAALDVEELGSVYESLLEFQPVFSESGGKLTFDLLTGTERKSTGSYYTPPELVNELIQRALVPVIEDRLKQTKTPAEKENQLLMLTVCDPACGSGHFLLAAARRIGRELAKVRTGDEEPSPEQMRLAIRDVITHCIYGVDKNPLAVDLCKVALWLEGHTTSKPLTFLDHRIRCGDSLVGVFDLSVLKDGIPDEAFNAVTGDDKAVASEIKKQNKKEREHRQLREFDVAMGVLTSSRQQVNAIADDSPEDIRRKRELFSAFQREGTAWCKDKTACDLWTSAFFLNQSKENFRKQIITTTNTVREYLTTNSAIGLPQINIARQLASRHRFFHWPLEFPEVFINGGFDCIVGNPPWEKIQVEEQAFFFSRDLLISKAKGSKRKELIKKLKLSNPRLLEEFHDHRRTIELIDKFIKTSTRFPYTGQGKMNSYANFTELFHLITRSAGRCGIVVPLGLITDDNNKDFFSNLLVNESIDTMEGFENENFIFSDVHHAFKFILLILTGQYIKKSNIKCAFYLRKFSDIKDKKRWYSLSKSDIQSLNPNTNTAPIFRTINDAIINKRIYQNHPVIINEKKIENPYDLSIHRMFNPTDDSIYFRSQNQLVEEDFKIHGYIFLKNTEKYFPIYESKMIHHYDHRFGTYKGQTESQRNQGKLPELTEGQHQDPYMLSLPQNWITSELIDEFIGRKTKKQWLFVYRDITSSVVLRTAISTIIPRTATVDPCRVIYFNDNTPIKNVIVFLGCFNSIIFDYFSRQKVSGNHLAIFVLKQLPIVSPRRYNIIHISFIVPRVLELTYTAWDIKAFADDVWRDSDDSMKTLLRQQWEENKAATGGHTWAPPEWAEIEPDGIPLPPFKWDEDRRAVLRAELDALYARLYGLTRDELRYILDPSDVYGPDFPGETFRVLKEKEIKKYGEYRTRRLVLEAWDKMEGKNE